MSYSIAGTTITLTRGDTFKALISITDANGEAYTPVEGDSITFGVKANYTDDEVLILKDIPTDTMLLTLDPADTAGLDFGNYVYDIELTTSDGEVYTFITKSSFILTAEVH
ncbi:MAG: hypothetical protein LUE92_12150 [Clostridiales bacterium]|nr:hypothetical protein [Clostridiales bacterium]